MNQFYQERRVQEARIDLSVRARMGERESMNQFLSSSLVNLVFTRERITGEQRLAKT
jgi:hypothetical protein